MTWDNYLTSPSLGFLKIRVTYQFYRSARFKITYKKPLLTPSVGEADGGTAV